MPYFMPYFATMSYFHALLRKKSKVGRGEVGREVGRGPLTLKSDVLLWVVRGVLVGIHMQYSFLCG